MIELSPLATFLIVFAAIVAAAFMIYAIGLAQGKKVKEKEYIAEIVKQLDIEDHGDLVERIVEAGETHNLLQTEQDRLINKFIAIMDERKKKG